MGVLIFALSMEWWSWRTIPWDVDETDVPQMRTRHLLEEESCHTESWESREAR